MDTAEQKTVLIGVSGELPPINHAKSYEDSKKPAFELK